MIHITGRFIRWVKGFAIHNTGSRKFLDTGAGGDFNGDGLNDIIVGALGDPELTDGVARMRAIYRNLWQHCLIYIKD